MKFIFYFHSSLLYFILFYLFSYVSMHDFENEMDKIEEFNNLLDNGKVLGFGDSLTKGLIINKQNRGRSHLPYINELRKKISMHNSYYRDDSNSSFILEVGISGETTSEMVQRLPLELNKLSKNLSIVLILGGTNDLFRYRGTIIITIII